MSLLCVDKGLVYCTAKIPSCGERADWIIGANCIAWSCVGFCLSQYKCTVVCGDDRIIMHARWCEGNAVCIHYNNMIQ